MNYDETLEAAKAIRDHCEQQPDCTNCALTNENGYCACLADLPRDWNISDRKAWTKAEQALALSLNLMGYAHLERVNTWLYAVTYRGGRRYARRINFPCFTGIKFGDLISLKEIVREGGLFRDQLAD